MNIDSAEELRAPWEVIRDEKRKKKDEFMKSMIKVKFTINSTMLKNYMIQEDEASWEERDKKRALEDTTRSIF